MNPRIVAVNGSKKGTTFPLEKEEVTIGRESANTVCLNHASVSRRHCLIRRQNEDFKILDLDSYNGTFVNGIPVKEQELAHADQLRIGSIELLFLVEEGDQTISGHVHWDDSDPLTHSAKQLPPETLLHQTEEAMASKEMGADIYNLTKFKRSNQN
ncbi:MAG: FHA domain-containing protein, partial [Pyrinomonadaceae bacterium]